VPKLASSLNAVSLIRTRNDLTKQLDELKRELLTLRVQKIAGGSASKLTKMYAGTSRSVKLGLTYV
jgi:hypothetical protein